LETTGDFLAALDLPLEELLLLLLPPDDEEPADALEPAAGPEATVELELELAGAATPVPPTRMILVGPAAIVFCVLVVLCPMSTPTRIASRRVATPATSDVPEPNRDPRDSRELIVLEVVTVSTAGLDAGFTGTENRGAPRRSPQTTQ
jgi:hypothetical protein